MVLAALLLLTACQSWPTDSVVLESARADFWAAEENAHVREFARAELNSAREAITAADLAWKYAKGSEELEHLAYLAKQRVAIAQATAACRRAASTQAGAVLLRGQTIPTVHEARTGQKASKTD